MAHMIESMFSVRQAPWHKLGGVVQDAPSAADAIRLAGLDWPVERRRLSLPDGRLVNRWAVVRTTDGAVVGDAVGPHWTPLQNRDAFEWFDPFVVAGQARFATAGSLCGGRRVWVLAELSRAPVEVVHGDAVRKFLLLSNSHDGSLAVRVGFTPVRVVCANTLSAAHAGKDSQLIRLRHCSGLRRNLANVRETIDRVNACFEATAEQYRRLAVRGISQADLRRYVARVLEAGDKPGARLANIMEGITGLVEAGAGNDGARVRGTYWAAFNGVTHWLSHERGLSPDGRLNSLWFGDGARLNDRALSVALEMAG